MAAFPRVGFLAKQHAVGAMAGLDGVAAAKHAGLQVKINTVALKGVNEDEIDDLLAWCGREDLDLPQARGEDRDVLIRMNSPLRHAGDSYYQASFEPGDQVSVLQVVRNPASLTPYVACSLVAHWARAGTIGRVTGALLVAPADVDALAPLLSRPRAWQVVEVLIAATMLLVAARLALG